jgi:hypothetical protein
VAERHQAGDELDGAVQRDPGREHEADRVLDPAACATPPAGRARPARLAC